MDNIYITADEMKKDPFAAGAIAAGRESKRVGGKAIEMTLRDYFAAHALQGLLANDGFYNSLARSAVAENPDPTSVAFYCLDMTTNIAYHYADAMLLAREKKEAK